MPQQPLGDRPNPYAVAAISSHSKASFASSSRGPEKRPGFCTFMFILDFIICVARLPLVYFGFLGAVELEKVKLRLAIPIDLIWCDVFAGVAGLAFGLLANAILLMNKRFGAILGFLAVFFAGASVAITYKVLMGAPTQAVQQNQQYTMILGAVGIMLRVIVNGLYVLALLKFLSWLNRRNATFPADPRSDAVATFVEPFDRL